MSNVTVHPLRRFTRSYRYRVIKSERIPGGKFRSQEIVVAVDLPLKRAREMSDQLSKEVHAAHPSETSWTLPVYYIEQEPQQEFDLASESSAQSAVQPSVPFVSSV